MWGAILGAIMGGAVEASKKDPMTLDLEKMGLGPTMDYASRQGWVNPVMGELGSTARGEEVGISQGELNRMLAGQQGRLEATGAANRQRITERALSSGLQGSGIEEAAMDANDRALLDAKRQGEADAMNFALAQRAADRDRKIEASKVGLGFVGDERDYSLKAKMAEIDSINAARALGPKWARIGAGALGGAQSWSGLG